MERGVSGDFQLLCALGNAASAVFAIVLSVLFHLHWITGLLLTAYTLVANYYQYGTAFFRLKLDFKGNFFAYTVSAVSYAAAACLLSTPLLWPAVFLIGELAGLLYTCAVTKFQREPFTRTPLLQALRLSARPNSLGARARKIPAGLPSRVLTVKPPPPA